MQGIDSMATYAYGTNKDLVCNKEGIKCNKKKKQKKTYSKLATNSRSSI